MVPLSAMCLWQARVQSEFCGGRLFECGEEVSLYTVVEHHLEEFVRTDRPSERNAECVEIVQALSALYNLCLEGLRKRSFSFPATALPEIAAHKCLDLGLLLQNRDRRSSYQGRVTITLPHITMQEWCAARACSSETNSVSSARECLGDFGVEKERWEFWKFFVGTARSDVLDEILAGMKNSSSLAGSLAKRFRLFLMRCFMEHRLSTGKFGSKSTSIPPQSFTFAKESVDFIWRDP